MRSLHLLIAPSKLTPNGSSYTTDVFRIASSMLRLPRKLLSFPSLSNLAQKSVMYLRVRWIGKPSTNLEKEVKTAIESCYGFVITHLVFNSKRMLPVARKDFLPTIQKSFVILVYEYKCHCDSRYVG